jgi:inorganic pyrophosphatase
MSINKGDFMHNVGNVVEVVVEIPMGSDPVKYEVDAISGEIYLDRFLDTAMYYPCNYGFVPDTLADDGDPIDVLVMSPYPLLPGCKARCRIIGMLDMLDEEGTDHKLFAVPIDRTYNDWHDVEDIPTRLKNQIKHFFQHYKDLEPDKWTQVTGWKDADTAREALKNAIKKPTVLIN